MRPGDTGEARPGGAFSVYNLSYEMIPRKINV
jgi:hypothetical protein